MDNQIERERVGRDLAERHGENDLFAAALRGACKAMLLADARRPGKPIVFANDAFLQLTGYARDEVLGRSCSFLQGPGTDQESVEAIRRALAEGRALSIEILNYRKDGTAFWNAVSLSPVADASGAPEYYFAVLSDVSDKREAELALKEAYEGLERAVDDRTLDLQTALDQKTMLLHEVDHRVKNNLQLISSLIQLQLRRSAEPVVKEALRGVLDRVGAISTVHRRLFQSDDVRRFDVAEFVADLIEDLSSGAAERGIRFELDLEPVFVSSGKAAPVSLIVNELVANAMKHAYPEGKGGLIRVAVRREGEKERIVVQDDGVGFDMGDAKTVSGGRHIIELLSRQLRATTTWEGANPGTRAVVLLPSEGEGAG
ncbi:histidine kinase dimerization/phosphoacceptor domain -containing protein [Caulobacter sp. 17J80-11]|uniref:histidine kinase dimerization/phosphoacceptor domain -containing protein n=1 Tax=Caulobacter sp. 17J80-11 TaxID=2763502 RepID=UPI001653A431|nr:histidine kinase dimerization/phosphoacceptor domain -containing protein [Caulobacter sp. 17J80-11]MBC6981841.1 PAS domain-containing protein [Caulobacter sp. 17J80-11]